MVRVEDRLMERGKQKYERIERIKSSAPATFKPMLNQKSMQIAKTNKIGGFSSRQPSANVSPIKGMNRYNTQADF